MKNTSREQDALIDRASQSVGYVVSNLIDTIQSLDERLSESMEEVDRLRGEVSLLEQDIAELEAKQ
jgi:phage shock protein A